ncbi:MAG: coenzyme F420-0:L-glutamate ligase [Actinomycetes bacterium]
MPDAGLTATPLAGLPEVAQGADLGEMVAAAAAGRDLDGAVLVVSHKAVSKAEGALRHLADVVPGQRALEIAAQQDRDPRHVEVILEQTDELLRAEHGVLICVTHHGFVCANAGVDASNAPGEETLVLLPRDPDGSARRLRSRVRDLTGSSPAVVIADSFGRAWRFAQVDVAVGCAGLTTIDDWAGRPDRSGRELSATAIAIADSAAAAADLARSKDSGEPVVVIDGLARFVSDDDGPGAAALLRPAAQDLFRR